MPDWTDNMTVTPLASFPPMEKWDDWTEWDPEAWPKRVERRYMLVPTTCFNCEAACGLIAYIDKSTWSIQKLEGNPHHPGSRGRNCAKGPATINQVLDPQRILYPMKRSGPRGSGKFERTTWDEALDAFAKEIRKAIVENRKTEVMYHVGRPGHDGYMDRILQSWGVDGHNSHTNVCSAGARLGYALWQGADRPSPDHANARFILLLSSHLETGHYFNPHAQRIIEGKMAGAKICSIDIRLSNTASMSNYWLAPWPGTEAAILLAMAAVIIDEGYVNAEFVRKFTNWEEMLEAIDSLAPDGARGTDGAKGNITFDRVIPYLRSRIPADALAWAEKESRVPKDKILEVAREIGRAGTAFASHVWRNTAAGNLGGWQVARCLEFVSVLVGAVGTKGGTLPNSYNKFVPVPFMKPGPQSVWSELLFPREYSLAHYEMSYLLPHLLREGRGRISAYFTRVYNPVWTNPDGVAWMDILTKEKYIGLHGALTPTWNETALFADYVLPMGHGPERHDIQSQETQAGKWIGFRQPVLRVARERMGEKFEHTYQANPGEVWEEDEWWINLSWRVDPDGSLGIRKYYESPYRPGQRVSVEEYYRWIFENSVPGLPKAAADAKMSPLDYMRRHGAFLVENEHYEHFAEKLDAKTLVGATVDAKTKKIIKDGKAVGVEIDGEPLAGFPTPSRKLEIYSKTMADFGWPEQTMPAYIQSHVHPDKLDITKGEMALVPTFRLPTLIHTRSGNAKWLYELSNSNPVWMHPSVGRRLKVKTGDLVRVTTRLGYFVNKVWVTEGILPGIVACSHHLGRWRTDDSGVGVDKWAAAEVKLDTSNGKFKITRVKDIAPFDSTDPDSKRVWWVDGGVHQNLTFPVQPDPWSGMHCWHQKVVVEKARTGDRYGDVEVWPEKSQEIYKEWLAMTRPPKAGGLRRPLWMNRPLRPVESTYYLPKDEK
ncbi:MAG: molybdopterin-dependent oxidoreductase [Planctomycetes bacterium]|nr:molybdopterin-dependent oxidoreductase [Planctomycetota bacterium]